MKSVVIRAFDEGGGVRHGIFEGNFNTPLIYFDTQREAINYCVVMIWDITHIQGVIM